MITKINNNKGNAVLKSAIIVVGFVIVFSAILEYIKINTILNGIYTATENAVIEVATINWDSMYPSIREGVTGGYEYDGSSWREILNSGDVQGRLMNVLGLDYTGSRYVDGSFMFGISDVHTQILNTPMHNKHQMLETKTIMKVTIPLIFFGSKFSDITINMGVKVEYHQKF